MSGSGRTWKLMDRIWQVVLAAALFPPAAVLAQNNPLAYDRAVCLKVTPGQSAAFQQFLNDTLRKAVQARADRGEIASWLLLRTVFPEGEEARCDYLSITTWAGIPPASAPLELSGAPVRIVSTEMWRTVILVGGLRQGDYLYMNFMKVHDAPNYLAFEQNIWKPMGEAWVKDGTFHAWLVMTPFLPSGTGLPYQLISADVFPTWEQAFRGEEEVNTWKRVHPEMTLQEAEERLGKLRDLDRRYFLTVQEKVVKRQ